MGILDIVGIYPVRKDNMMSKKDKNDRAFLKKILYRLDNYQMKLFYGILVHCWASQKAFISTQNFRNLWCELNYVCAEIDDSFPDPYDDFELLKSFCQAHPYYFIDILDQEQVINLFCQHLENRIDILATVAAKLHTEGLWAACAYATQALGLNEDADELVAQAEEHVQTYS